MRAPSAMSSTRRSRRMLYKVASDNSCPAEYAPQSPAAYLDMCVAAIVLLKSSLTPALLRICFQ